MKTTFRPNINDIEMMHYRVYFIYAEFVNEFFLKTYSESVAAYVNIFGGGGGKNSRIG